MNNTNSVLKKGKIPGNNTTSGNTVRKQSPKVSFNVSEEENELLAKMAYDRSMTKTQLIRTRVFSPESASIILPHSDDIRCELAGICDILKDIHIVLTSKRDLNIVQVKEALNNLLDKLQSVTEAQVRTEQLFTDIISVISRYSGGNTADITDDIDDNDALEDI